MPLLLKTLFEPSLKALFIGRSEIGADNSAVPTSNSLHPATPKPLVWRARRARHSTLKAFWSGAVWLVLAAGLPAQASERSDRSARADHDHDRARNAVQSGAVLPLPALLEKLQRSHPGQVLELELEHEDGRWLYEVKLLHKNGQLLKIKLDAATGDVLEVKQRAAERPGEKSRERGETPAKPTPAPKTP